MRKNINTFVLQKATRISAGTNKRITIPSMPFSNSGLNQKPEADPGVNKECVINNKYWTCLYIVPLQVSI